MDMSADCIDLPHLLESDDSLVDEVGESAEGADDYGGASAEVLLLHGDGRASVANAHAHDRAERELSRLIVDLLHQFTGRRQNHASTKIELMD